MTAQRTKGLFDHLKVNDQVQVVEWDSKEERPEKPKQHEAKVIKITEDMIVCLVKLDQPRRREFSRRTGMEIGECRFTCFRLSEEGK